jgi:hypothetical protein
MDGLKVYGIIKFIVFWSFYFLLSNLCFKGRHLSVAAEGHSIPLDLCGGHSHGSYGYHYHSQVLRFNVTKNGNGLLIGQTITGAVAGPYQC